MPQRCPCQPPKARLRPIRRAVFKVMQPTIGGKMSGLRVAEAVTIGALGRDTSSPKRQLTPPVTLTPVSWAPSREFGLREWIQHGQRLGTIGRACAWWIGDWLRYGNAKHGEKYSRAARITGYDAKSLMNMVYVATRFEVSRRRENLSWSHHAAIASLDVHQQERWLDFSERQGLSVHCLRLELASQRSDARKQAANKPEGSVAGGHANSPIACPRCGTEFIPALSSVA